MRITTHSQLMDLLDGLYADGADRTSGGAAAFWDDLLAQPDHPLGRDLPDSSLVWWRDAGALGPGAGRTALDIGCGLGRNSRWLAQQGFAVTGVDVSPYAVTEAARRSPAPGTAYVLGDFLREPVAGGPFDLVYDSGCFHHLAPHRRISYLASLDKVLAPGGLFGICTFTAGRMGTSAPDSDLLLGRSLEGGVGYSIGELHEMFSCLEPLDARPLPDQHEVDEPVFTHDFLQVALFRRPPPPTQEHDG